MSTIISSNPAPAGTIGNTFSAGSITTSALEKRPVLVIILNNYFLGMVRQWQELFYKERFSSSCLTAEGGNAAKNTQPDPSKVPYVPDFVKLAEAHGGVGIRVMEKTKLTSALEQALKEVKHRTVVMDVVIDPAEKVFPMVPAGAGLDEIIVDMA